MSNLLTLSQDEIDRFELKGKQVGDTITAEEYSKLQKESIRISKTKAIPIRKPPKRNPLRNS